VAKPTRTVLQILVDEKLSDTEIGNALGVTSQTVYRWRKAEGIASQWEPPRAQHGTAAKYQNGCRCAPCTKANTEYCRRFTGAKPRTEPEHGTASRYVHRGCRCDLCRAAQSAAARARYARKKAEQ